MTYPFAADNVPTHISNNARIIQLVAKLSKLWLSLSKSRKSFNFFGVSLHSNYVPSRLRTFCSCFSILRLSLKTAQDKTLWTMTPVATIARSIGSRFSNWSQSMSILPIHIHCKQNSFKMKSKSTFEYVIFYVCDSVWKFIYFFTSFKDGLFQKPNFTPVMTLPKIITVPMMILEILSSSNSGTLLRTHKKMYFMVVRMVMMLTKVTVPKTLRMLIIKQSVSGNGPIHIPSTSNPTTTTSYIISWN